MHSTAWPEFRTTPTVSRSKHQMQAVGAKSGAVTPADADKRNMAKTVPDGGQKADKI
jgi:hypothetical protein